MSTMDGVSGWVLNWARNKHLGDPVAGTYQLTSCSSGSNNAVYSDSSMHGVVVAPGIGAVAVDVVHPSYCLLCHDCLPT